MRPLASRADTRGRWVTGAEARRLLLAEYSLSAALTSPFTNRPNTALTPPAARFDLTALATNLDHRFFYWRYYNHSRHALSSAILAKLIRSFRRL